MTTSEVAWVRVETKLDLALARLDDHESRMRQLEKPSRSPTDIERRVRFLERAIWVAAGIGIAGGGLVSTLLTQIAPA